MRTTVDPRLQAGRIYQIDGQRIDTRGHNGIFTVQGPCGAQLRIVGEHIRRGCKL